MEGYGNENPGAFQPTRPLRGATARDPVSLARREKFQPTRPLRGATPHNIPISADCQISTHAPLAGRDHQKAPARSGTDNFNPRAPCGARRQSPMQKSECQEFQPTRPLRGATKPAKVRHLAMNISTHAPLAGRDTDAARRCPQKGYFNPRAPCGARRGHGFLCPFSSPFQPTRPLRGATSGCRWLLDHPWHFNPRAPCGARQEIREDRDLTQADFNPRAPCGARHKYFCHLTEFHKFQPTRPLRGATSLITNIRLRYIDFNPRAPCGARHIYDGIVFRE